jgi:hypothetical protein
VQQDVASYTFALKATADPAYGIEVMAVFCKTTFQATFCGYEDLVRTITGFSQRFFELWLPIMFRILPGYVFKHWVRARYQDCPVHFFYS